MRASPRMIRLVGALFGWSDHTAQSFPSGGLLGDLAAARHVEVRRARMRKRGEAARECLTSADSGMMQRPIPRTQANGAVPCVRQTLVDCVHRRRRVLAAMTGELLVTLPTFDLPTLAGGASLGS